MTEATCIYASIEDLKRSPEELKEHRISGSVPIYEPVPTNDVRAILELAKPYVANSEDMEIVYREIQGTKPDYHSTKDVRIGIYADTDEGRALLNPHRGQSGDRIDLGELEKVVEDFAEYSNIRLRAIVINRHGPAKEYTVKDAGFFIRRFLTHDSFLAMREDGKIEAWT